MAKYTGPACRLCRREGMKLYLKGTAAIPISVQLREGLFHLDSMVGTERGSRIRNPAA